MRAAENAGTCRAETRGTHHTTHGGCSPYQRNGGVKRILKNIPQTKGILNVTIKLWRHFIKRFIIRPNIDLL